MQDLKTYIEKNRRLPYAILLKGQTAPKFQVLKRQPNNGYVISHEANQFEHELYSVEDFTATGRGLKHQMFQKIDRIVGKIVRGKFEGYALTEPELEAYLAKNLRGTYPGQPRN